MAPDDNRGEDKKSGEGGQEKRGGKQQFNEDRNKPLHTFIQKPKPTPPPKPKEE